MVLVRRDWIENMEKGKWEKGKMRKRENEEKGKWSKIGEKTKETGKKNNLNWIDIKENWMKELEIKGNDLETKIRACMGK